MTKSGRSIVLASAAIATAFALSACGGSEESSTASAPASEPAAEPAAAPVAEAPAAQPVTVAETTSEPAAETPAPTHSEPAAAEAVEVAAAEPAPEAEATVIPVAAQAGAASEYASLTGDPAAGKRVFVKCMACHVAVEGQNRVGPSLYGIVGRPAGTIPGFAYSDANKNSGIVWSEEIMFAYLENPQEYIPGTKMVFPGLPAAQDRADVIAYLKSVVK